MASSLLATKLRIPPPTRPVVHRARLVDAIEHEVARYKLSLLSAPAGYGKTTLLADWARSSHLPVAWLSLDAEDNDLERFLRYLFAAWEAVQPGIGESPLGMLLGAMAPERDAVLAAFINVANDLPGHNVLVIDDAHLLNDAEIYQALTFLIDHLPPTLHVVLAGRAAPPLPLARYRTRQELLELGVEELQFSAQEAEDLLNGLMELELTGEALVSLHTQLEGWAAGLQLAALTLRRRLEADTFAISGRQRFIADYLIEDVLAHLPGATRQFLLQTSILDRLCGALCDAVTGRDDGQAMLEIVERENLFLVPLDDNREWYRYHRLFADVLQEELTRRHPDVVVNLHRRAAAWYLVHEMPEPAFRHAVAGDDIERVIQILERYESLKLHGGELSVLRGWLDSLPAGWYEIYPMLGLARAGLLAFTGALDDCIRCIDDVEFRLAQVQTDDTRWQMARVIAYRCFMACFLNDLEQAEAFANQALRDLRDDDLGFRADIYHALGDTYRRNGRWVEAQAAYLKVHDLAHGNTVRLQAAHVFGALADLELRRGRLQDAAVYWRQALAAIQERENWGRLPLPVIGWVYSRMGELLYEWNEQAEAWNHLSRGLELAELGGDVRAMIASYLIAGRAKLTEGDVDTAADYLERARSLVEQAAFPEWTSRFERFQLELWLAQDRLRTAVDWADRLLRSGVLQERPESEVAQLAVVRALIVKGDLPSRGQALALLDRLLHMAEEEGRAGVQIEALALQALARWQGGDRAGAMTALEHALRLAEPEGYVRLFADLGLPMARLLQEARTRDVMPDYVARLLAACGDALPAAADRSLPEPLTEREREVVALLAAGLTNREIANRLVISPQTVKKHTGNIYGKLGVRTRSQAAARGRELGLLR